VSIDLTLLGIVRDDSNEYLSKQDWPIEVTLL
jgi:hypothetical protein